MIKTSSIEEIKSLLGDDFVACKSSGNTLWLVRKIADIPRLSQIRFNGDERAEVRELDGPDQVFCPLSILNQAVEENGEWRKKVLDYWRAKDESKRMWREIKSRFQELQETEAIKVYFKSEWNLNFAFLEDPIAGKVRHEGKLWKIKQRDSVCDWEVIEL